jgi:cytochrome o ubiquinol oxidase subunit 2
MGKKYKFGFFILLLLVVALFLALFLTGSNIAVLNPKGIVALQQRDLIVVATLLIAAVVVPVIILTFFIAWKYRESNTKAKYTPDWDHSKALEFTWWVIPAVVILILAVITWKSTHALDPYKPLEASAKPITIQVIALRWKWLFIYPEQNIATVNFVQFPERTPINFELTADAPMNSFWIPQLGGQIYAMAGMRTQLYLMADTSGEFAGAAAEINGRGFSGMKFTAKASSQAAFDTWVQSVKQAPKTLSLVEYKQLAKPSESDPVSYYSQAQAGLYDSVVMKYMMPALPTGGPGINMNEMEMQ